MPLLESDLVFPASTLHPITYNDLQNWEAGSITIASGVSISGNDLWIGPLGLSMSGPGESTLAVFSLLASSSQGVSVQTPIGGTLHVESRLAGLGAWELNGQGSTVLSTSLLGAPVSQATQGLRVRSGTLVVEGDVRFTGEFTVEPTARLDVQGRLALNGAATHVEVAGILAGAGLIEQEGGLVHLHPADAFAFSGQIQARAGTLRANGSWINASLLVGSTATLDPVNLEVGSASLSPGSRLAFTVQGNLTDRLQARGDLDLTGVIIETEVQALPDPSAVLTLVTAAPLRGTPGNLGEFVARGGRLALAVDPDRDALVLARLAAPTVITVTSSANPALIDSPVLITARVAPRTPYVGTPGGRVVFWDGANPLGTSVLDASGAALLSLAVAGSALSLGDHEISVQYEGSAEFLSMASAPLTQAVRMSAGVALQASANPVSLLDPLTLRVAVTGGDGGPSTLGTPSGFVTLRAGGQILAVLSLDDQGQAAWTTDQLGVGMRYLIAEYSGDGAYAPSSSATLALTVERLTSSTVVGVSSVSSVIGEPITLTADVRVIRPIADGEQGSPPSPGGSVMFLDGLGLLGTAMLDSLGRASLTIQPPGIGIHRLSAVYVGDALHAGGNAAVIEHRVWPGASELTLATSPRPARLGQTVVLRAQTRAVAPASGTPSGSVEFYDGDRLLGTSSLGGDGVAELSTRDIGLGQRVLTARFLGEHRFLPSQGAGVSFALDPAQATVVLSAGGPTATAGRTVELTASILPNALGIGTPTGQVVFHDGFLPLGWAVVDDQGIARLRVPDLTTGTHVLRASYAGDGRFASAWSLEMTLNVLPASAEVRLLASSPTSRFGDSLELTAQVQPGLGAINATPTGRVVFLADGEPIGEAAVNAAGVAVWSGSVGSAGTRLISARYLGDASWNAVESPGVAVRVQRRDSKVILEVVTGRGASRRLATLRAVLDPRATGRVTFRFGRFTRVVDLNQGVAVLQIDAALARSRNLVVLYEGDGNFLGGQSRGVRAVSARVR